MSGYLLAPHNDDESLFAAYTALRHKPDVIVVLRCAPWPTRFLESSRAALVLGVPSLTQWPYLEDNAEAHAAEIEAKIAALPGHVWAPLPEPDGHAHHNLVGEIASRRCADVSYYTTYTPSRRTVGEPVLPEAGWEARKLEALECYTTQQSRIAEHLARGTEEYSA